MKQTKTTILPYTTLPLEDRQLHTGKNHFIGSSGTDDQKSESSQYTDKKTKYFEVCSEYKEVIEEAESKNHERECSDTFKILLSDFRDTAETHRQSYFLSFWRS